MGPKTEGEHNTIHRPRLTPAFRVYRDIVTAFTLPKCQPPRRICNQAKNDGSDQTGATMLPHQDSLVWCLHMAGQLKRVLQPGVAALML